MDRFIINGGTNLLGRVRVSGAKNAAVAILPAVLVSDEVCIIENLPMVSDVIVILDILAELGARVDIIDEHSVRIDATGDISHIVPMDMARNIRATYYFLGALLTRLNKATVPMPGGDDLGPRPIDQHLKAFTAIGGSCEVEYGVVKIDAKHGLSEARVFFDLVTVGATINAMLASVKIDGI
ncbi:MAG: UDP-N-acetylglucosamine 1-carboxyvinyltransferase, partial [Oscillospiraceae bacterium]|nr:UDP-N-acetylglucosamine 1-carboxyvinyltransferase [Oscillospiraceae bacterium]